MFSRGCVMSWGKNSTMLSNRRVRRLNCRSSAAVAAVAAWWPPRDDEQGWEGDGGEEGDDRGDAEDRGEEEELGGVEPPPRSLKSSAGSVSN